MDKATFFAYAKRAPFGVRLSQRQVDGINAIFEQWEYYRLYDRRRLAYVLATVMHETGGRMVPVRETFAGSDTAAIKALDSAFAKGQLKSVKTPYWRVDGDGKSWFGRGAVQITHKRNYQKLGERLEVDLVGRPKLALDLEVSAKIVIVGMEEGLFTGKRLSDYFNGSTEDPVGARAVVNGRDKASLIATYYRGFLDAINAAHLAKERGGLPDVAAKDALPDDLPAKNSRSIWAIVTAIFTGGSLGFVQDMLDGGASFLHAISNPWAFASVLSLLVSVGIMIWLFETGRLTFNRDAQR